MRRFLLWVLALLVTFLFAGGWYARNVWEEWTQANNLSNLEWQGAGVSLSGVQLARFSVTQRRDGHNYQAVGEALSLGWSWNWRGLMPDLVPGRLRVEQLTVTVPAWPGPSEPGQSPPALPRQLPYWLPDDIAIDQLVLTLPDGIRATGDLAVSGLSSPDSRHIVTNGLAVEAPIPEMVQAGWRLHYGKVRLVVSGNADEQSATLNFREGSQVEFAAVEAPDNAGQVDNARVDLSGTTLAAGYSLQPAALRSLALKGPLVATAATIHQQQLHPQSWRLEGQTDSSLEGLGFDGRLSSNAGTGAGIRLRVPFGGIAELEADMAAVGAAGGRALANTFTAWPETLEIGEGKLKTVFKLRLPPNGIQLQGEVSADGLGGLFGRTAWAGLRGRASVNLAGNRLDFQTSGVTLDTVNPGIALNDIRVAGRYSTTTDKNADGTARLESASARLLGGDLRIEPAQWQLSKLPLRMPLQLKGVELSQLMQVYPAEGLAGSGVLRGTIPLQISRQGVSIDAGQIEALAPGGSLKLPADSLSGMAQDNEAMALVVRAMQNFNYSVLSSTVDYDQDGKLALGMRLEGSSPDVRSGHPIVLNINLEEDIPALLTSLQLAGRVNDAVTEKVRNLLQKREAKSQPTGSNNESAATE